MKPQTAAHWIRLIAWGLAYWCVLLIAVVADIHDGFLFLLIGGAAACGFLAAGGRRELRLLSGLFATVGFLLAVATGPREKEEPYEDREVFAVTFVSLSVFLAAYIGARARERLSSITGDAEHPPQQSEGNARSRAVNSWLRWSAPVVCALLLVLYFSTAAGKWYYRSATTGRRFAVELVCGAGAVSLNWIRVGWLDLPWGDPEHGWQPVSELSWVPAWERSREGIRLEVPIWVPLLVSAAIGAWAWIRRPPIPPGLCLRCGYNLTGNISGKCPECGTEIRVKPQAADD